MVLKAQMHPVMWKQSRNRYQGEFSENTLPIDAIVLFVLCSGAHCRQENGLMCIPPMETSFGHWNTLLLSQDENLIIGRIFAGNPNIWFFRCLPNWDVISSLNPPNSCLILKILMVVHTSGLVDY